MYESHTASQTRDPHMFATTSCIFGFFLGVVRVSCPGTLALYARPIVIIPLLLVDVRSLSRASLRFREGPEGWALCGGYPLRMAASWWRKKGTCRHFGVIAGELTGLSTG